ncbi:hypothetical protein KHA80_06625 [Anaerobacillus sp. HL2]|nr:hypothetical protein KHA80_06625 [Anaerobacillus sp. HL2]
MVYTMNYDKHTRETFLSLGVSQFLEKPLRPSYLIEYISNEIRKDLMNSKRKTKTKISAIVEFIDTNIYQDLTLLM